MDFLILPTFPRPLTPPVVAHVIWLKLMEAIVKKILPSVSQSVFQTVLC